VLSAATSTSYILVPSNSPGDGRSVDTRRHVGGEQQGDGCDPLQA
jgi:hypothetical protein